jgi:hypothetical protein
VQVARIGATIGAIVQYDRRGPRIDVELAAQIDRVRGDVPFDRFVRSLLSQAVGREITIVIPPAPSTLERKDTMVPSPAPAPKSTIVDSPAPAPKAPMGASSRPSSRACPECGSVGPLHQRGCWRGMRSSAAVRNPRRARGG